MTRILNEGGLAGHMNHLYDNYDLTFGGIKKIFIAAANGRLEGTEKTDGQNLFISYSVRERQVKAVRNKGDIKKGGMSPEELATKFAGRGAVLDAFVDGFKAFESSVKGLKERQLIKIFGQETNIFYNAEIMDPRNPNVIFYNKPTVLIHRAGHVNIDREDNKITPLEDDSPLSILETHLRKSARSINTSKFAVEINAIKKLKSLSDGTILSNYLGLVEKFMSSNGLSDSDTIFEYIVDKISDKVSSELAELSEERKELVIKRIMGVKGVSITQIKKGLDKDVKAKITAFIPNQKAMSAMKGIHIAPLEKIVHKFSIEMLKGLESAFILDQQEEVDRLKSKLHKAISAIEASDISEKYPDAFAAFQRQLKKVESAENVSTATEGFVFSFDGMTYKFTGNFAPMNQILGMFEYGRGKMPALKDTLQEGQDSGEKFVVFYPGGFKPPHKGHYEVIKFYQSNPKVDKIFIIFGSSPRPKKASELAGQSQVTQEHTIAIWDLYGVGGGNVEFVPVTDKGGPMRFMYEKMMAADSKYLKPYINKGYSVVIGTSQKGDDAKRAKQFVNYYERNPDKLPEGIDVTEGPCCPAIADGDMELSATKFRTAIKNRDVESIKKLIPTPSDDLAQKIINIVTAGGEIKEISSMAGGAVEGYAGPIGEPKKKKKKKKLKEWLNGEILKIFIG